VDQFIYAIGGGWRDPDGNFGPINSVEAGTLTSLPPVLYTKQDGLTSGCCDSWDNACDLQYALTSATSGQEIWVAAGVYKPGTTRTDTFQLKSGVGLYGGFAGKETSRDERNWRTNLTVLSGDIDNNDVNIDGNFIAETTADIQGANAYHVVTGYSIDHTAVMDGFSITAGEANSSGNFKGGGMYNEYDSNPILRNIVFSGNATSDTPDLPGDGGGMYNFISSPILINVTFFANSASSGGGLYNSNSSNTILTSVLFSNNSAGSGAGMFISDGNPELNNVIFYANSASWSGGGLLNSNGSPRLINTTFFENSAATYGGGMDSSTYNPPSLISNIFWRNSALYGPQISGSYDSLNVTYSDVQGGWPGTGNIDADPLFMDAANGDLHLQAGSPAIDSGTNDGCPASDFDGAIRPRDGNYDGMAICDMGAYEFLGTVNSLPEITSLSGPTNPIRVGKTVSTSAVFTDPDANDTHTALWDWGDGSSGPGTVDGSNVTGTHIYPRPGLYTVTLSVADNGGGSDLATYQYVVVYDPKVGFVTGGGWIESPKNAHFEFVSSYPSVKATTPKGKVAFQYKPAKLNFISTRFEWLVIDGSKAQISGSGRINGKGNYAFLLSVTDNCKQDKFRIKVWDKATGEVVYDNQPGAADTTDPVTEVRGGSIVIHKSGTCTPPSYP